MAPPPPLRRHCCCGAADAALPPTPTLLLLLFSLLLLPHAAHAIPWNETFDFRDSPWNKHAGVQVLHDWMHVHATRTRWQLENLQERRARRPLRVLFVGDSTAREQNNFFCSAINDTFPSAVLGIDKRGPGHAFKCGSRELNVESAYAQTTCTPDSLPEHHNVSELHGADVVYFNYGLHLLHMHPALGLHCFPHLVRLDAMLGRALDLFKTWLNPGGLVVFFTTNWVCQKHFRGEYADLALKWSGDAPPPELLDSCVAATRKLYPQASAYGTPVTDADYRRACVDGALNTHGSEKVAAAGRAVVEKYQAKIADAGERPWLHIVDGHNMTRNACWATWVRDGRHYPFIQPLKVERMLSLLEDYLP